MPIRSGLTNVKMGVKMALSSEDKTRAMTWIKSRDAYKTAWWKLALKLGRYPTTKDKAYWDLPSVGRGEM